MPTDTPSPLAAAVEMLAWFTPPFRVHYERDHSQGMPVGICDADERPLAEWLTEANARALVAVLNSMPALCVNAAWRARAEAAVAVLEAEDTVRKFSSKHDAMWWDKDSRQRVSSMLDRDNALDALRAARRRYEEAARG